MCTLNPYIQPFLPKFLNEESSFLTNLETKHLPCEVDKSNQSWDTICVCAREETEWHRNGMTRKLWRKQVIETKWEQNCEARFYFSGRWAKQRKRGCTLRKKGTSFSRRMSTCVTPVLVLYISTQLILCVIKMKQHTRMIQMPDICLW